jgi:hypothetical protein
MCHVAQMGGVIALLCIPTHALAQACGTLAGAAEHLVMHRDVFMGEGWGDVRASLGIEPLRRSDSVGVVTDTLTCASLMRKEVANLGLPGSPDAVSYAIYRYGAYYAIEYRAPGRRRGDTTFYDAWPTLRVYTVEEGHMLKGTIRVSK